MRKTSVFITVAILLFIFAIPAYALPPALPDAFQGTVLINGSPAPDGTSVSATVSSGTIVNNTQNPVATKGGSYGITSNPLLVQGDIPSGATITFYVNGTAVPSVTATYIAGGGPTPENLSITITTGGSGGGGYYAPPVTTTPPATTTPPPTTTTPATVSPPPTGPAGGVNDISGSVNSSGVFTASVTATSQDVHASITIPAGDTGTTASNQPMTQITITPKTNLTGLPWTSDVNMVVAAYDFQPSGAKFNTPVPLTLTCKLSDLTSGADITKLYIAWFDTTTNKWVQLTTTAVISGSNVVLTANVSHFTVYSIFGPSGTASTPVPTVAQIPTPTTVPPTTIPVITATTPVVVTTAPVVTTPVITTTPPVTTQPPTTTPSGSKTGWIIGIVVVVVVLLGLVLVLVARRRRLH